MGACFQGQLLHSSAVQLQRSCMPLRHGACRYRNRVGHAVQHYPVGAAVVAAAAHIDRHGIVAVLRNLQLILDPGRTAEHPDAACAADGGEIAIACADAGPGVLALQERAAFRLYRHRHRLCRQGGGVQGSCRQIAQQRRQQDPRQNFFHSASLLFPFSCSARRPAAAARCCSRYTLGATPITRRKALEKDCTLS